MVRQDNLGIGYTNSGPHDWRATKELSYECLFIYFVYVSNFMSIGISKLCMRFYPEIVL